MRLRSLELRNYRRHVHTRLELPDGVTALVGANGAGKSTLLEALGFALFGTDALRTSKTLLRTDAAAPADAVEVRAELELGGQAIAIHRELRGKSLTPSASLTIDGVVVVPAGAGSSEAATQQLQRRLGLDADAFFTTVVARQGELAALSSQSPADRKRLVLRMLGVDRLDAAIERARQSRRDTETTVKALRTVLPDQTDLENRAKQATVEVEATMAALRAGEGRLAASRQALAAADAALSAELNAAEARRELATALEASRREQALLDAAAQAAQAAASNAAAAQARADELAHQAATHAALQDQWLAAQQVQQVMARRTQALDSLKRLEQEAAAARARVPRASLPAPAPLEPFELAVQESQARVERHGAALEVARAAATAAETRLTHLAHLGAGAPCPTCDRPLGGLATPLLETTRAAAASGRIEAERLARELAVAKRDIAGAREQLAAAQAARQRSELLAVEAAANHRAVADLERRIVEGRAALPAEVAPGDLSALRRQLDQARAAHDARQALQGLAQQLPALRKAADGALAATARQRERCTALAQQLAATPEPAHPLEAMRSAFAAAHLIERQADLDVHAARATLEAGKRRAADLQQRRAEAAALAAKLASAEADLREWTALTDGRAGLLERFRDHIVDRIGPAIQSEASRLLALFTGGRYSELVLDADYGLFLSDHGTLFGLDRFSGGEQDVAHLALRLAVSRLLAERAGATELRFLALDEVFGHLDEDRRGQVVAALHGLSGLYQQVLVVSHLQSLNEALDQAIVVDVVDGESRLAVRNG